MPCGCSLRKNIIKNKLILDNKKDVYLDYNATTKPDINVLSEAERLNRNMWGNPSSQNSRGVAIYSYIEKKISDITAIMKTDSHDVFFDTSSTSIINQITNALINTRIISTTTEHKSLLENSSYTIDVNEQGRLDINELESIIMTKKDNNLIFIYSPVNHETGAIQPFREIYKTCTRQNIKVIFDAVQLVSKIQISDWIGFCDGFYFSGHKIHALHGAAILCTKKGTINFNNVGSTLPFSLYKGTFNTSSAIALIMAFEIMIKTFTNYLKELRILHEEAKRILMKLDGLIIESPDNGAPGIINISIPEIKDIENLLIHLNRDNIHLSRFSACNGEIKEESKILKAMGRDKNRCLTSLRVSFGKYSKREDFFRLSSSISSFLASYNK